MTAGLLAHQLFIDPLPVGPGLAWTLALFLPLVAGVAVAYKTIKLTNLAHVPGQALRLFIQITLFMAAAAFLLAGFAR